MRNFFTFFIAISLSSISVSAQTTERVPSSSIYLNTVVPGGRIVSFASSGEGYRFNPIWGLDQAWISEQNFRKGINHMGRENVGVARSCFRVTKPLTNDTDLANDPINYLTRRNNIFRIHSDTLPLILTCDQEAGVDPYYRDGNTANVDRWSAMIYAHAKWLTENSRHRVMGVSPFNEPDYWTEEGATTTNSRDIAKKLRSDYPQMSNVAIVGGNTLNDDKAAQWYRAGKDYYDWGNTHQLAGSMENYKAFYQLLASDGKVGYNDEMHNVAEAFIGLENGMTVGIWWGFDSRARGEFCDISRHGVRLGYNDHPNNWTAATVYRHDDGRVKAFMGSSERQAVSTPYEFVCTDREVYYDGFGPTREIRQTIHGGTGYQKGQKNAECVIDVTWGADVAPSVIDGTYKIMSKATEMVVAERGELNGNPNISQERYTGSENEHWEVHPVRNTVDGDFSFMDIKSVKDGKHMDVLNFSTQSGANVISFGEGTPSSNQQWYLEYAGDGYYFIRNRESALYLTVTSSSKVQGVNINQQAKLEDTSRQMWRFIPVDAECETVAPSAPTGLRTTPNPASVVLEWDANTESDLSGYTIVRNEVGTDDWNTIARNLATTKFIDNTCQQGKKYSYGVKAIDLSGNISPISEMSEGNPTAEPAMTAHWTMEGALLDATDNQMDASSYGSPTYTATSAEGTKAISLNGTTQFVQLPYESAGTPDMTFAAWVNWRSTSMANQRIFDFGNGPSQYMYFTPSDGSGMSFVVNDGTGEQNVKCDSKLTASRWKHVAVSMSGTKVTIFVDGEIAGEGTLTIPPTSIRPCLNYIGRCQESTGPMLKAYIDDVMIFNYALDSDGVKAAMANATDGITLPSYGNQSETPDTYYSIDGKKTSHPTKGIYVKNGSKAIIK